MKRPLLALAIASLLLPSTALAATDGTLGDTSTGSLDLTLNITDPTSAAEIRISGLQDIVLDTTVGTSPATQDPSGVCVYMSRAGTYTVNISAEPLVLNQTAVPYKLGFGEATGEAASSVVLDVNQSIETGSLANLIPSLVSEDCTSGGIPAILRVFDVQAPTEAGTATTTITLTVTPD